MMKHFVGKLWKIWKLSDNIILSLRKHYHRHVSWALQKHDLIVKRGDFIKVQKRRLLNVQHDNVESE